MKDSSRAHNVKQTIRIEIVGLEWLGELFAQLTGKLDKMAKSQDELIAQVNEQGVKIDKIAGETRSLVDKVKELLEIIASGGPVKPELQAAVDAVDTQLQVVDDLVPDASEPPPEGGGPQPTPNR